MTKKITASLVVLVATIAIAQGQYITPNAYNMGSATLGLPKYFDAVFKNISSQPASISGVGCTTCADMDHAWLYKSDSSRFDSIIVPPGVSVNILVRITAVSVGLLMSQCRVGVKDSAGKQFTSQSFSTSGAVTYFPELSASVADLQFDITAPGSTSTRSVVLRNAGTGDAHVFVKSNNLTPFGIDSSGPWVIAAHDSITVNVTFSPTASGDASNVIEFAHVFLPGESNVQVQLHGSTSASEPEIVPLVPSIDFVEVTAGGTSGAGITFFASTAPVNVLSVILSDGEMFSILSPTFPTVVEASGTLVVFVELTSLVAGEFLDTLVLTTAKGTIIRVPLRARVLPVSVTETSSVRLLSPNPSTGVIQWDGHALEHWQIINSIGEVVNLVVADEDGKCRSHIDQPGFYMVVSDRTGKAIPFIVLK